MRLIDADKLFPYGAIPFIENDGFATADQLYGIIQNAPTVDAEPVVRCKDCIHQQKVWHEDKRRKNGGYWIYSCGQNEDQFVFHVVDGYDNEFCSHGERKTDGQQSDS